MHLLVAGGAGFIGSNFIRYQLATHPDCTIVNVDKLTYAGNLANLSDISNDPRYTFVQGDITDLEALNKTIQAHRITHVINFAAETHVDRSIHGGCKDFVLTNTLGVQMILDAVRANNIQKFVNVSTDEVYGSLELDSPNLFTENTPITPNMPYAAAKAGGDLMCRAYFVTHGVPVVVTHCSNNYGPYQFPEKLIPFFVFKLLKGEQVPVYGDGLNVRDWIHVVDHASALSLLLEKGIPGETYNIGVDNERNNLEITRTIIELMGLPLDRIAYIKDRPGHDRRYAIDASKIRSLGWKPDYTREKFRAGLEETIRWYTQNTAWVEQLWEKKRTEMNSFQTNMTMTQKIESFPTTTLIPNTEAPSPSSESATNPSQKILIFGAGYLGKRLSQLWPGAILSTVRIDDAAALARELDTVKPTAIINAVGRKGTPNIDWCETHQAETFHANTVAALLLAEQCQDRGIYLIQLSSGCIFYGQSPDPAGWSEEDATNPAAFYSRTKYATDLILSRLPNTAVARLRLPIDHIPSPFNTIDKLTSYKQVIDVQNSVTVIDDLAHVLRQLIEKRGTGIFHCTNPGVLRYRDLIKLYHEYVDPSHTNEWIQDQELASRGLTAKNRSTCILKSTRLAELGIHMRPIDIALRDTMTKYAPAKRALLSAQQTATASIKSSFSEAVAIPSVPSLYVHNARPKRMKGVITAGGSGTRLAPLTNITNKHLLPIYNKPQIMYPLESLLESGVKQIMLVTGPEYAHQFVKLLGSGSKYGCEISYRIQDQAGGIAQALSLTEDFIGDDNVTVHLGDNIFEESLRTYIDAFEAGASILYKEMADVRQYGVVEVNPQGKVLSIEEKPLQPKSNFAQLGLYIYDASVFEVIRNLKPSARGELEISEVNMAYLKQGKLQAQAVRGRWFDVGTFRDIKRANEYFAEKEGVY